MNVPRYLSIGFTDGNKEALTIKQAYGCLIGLLSSLIFLA